MRLVVDHSAVPVGYQTLLSPVRVIFSSEVFGSPFQRRQRGTFGWTAPIGMAIRSSAKDLPKPGILLILRRARPWASLSRAINQRSSYTFSSADVAASTG